MSKQPKARIGARNSRDGQFIPLSEANRRPETTQKEHIPLPGHGTSDRAKQR